MHPDLYTDKSFIYPAIVFSSLIIIPQSFSTSSDGVSLLNQSLEPLVPSLVALIDRPPSDGVSMRACENAAAALAFLASTDIGETLNPSGRHDMELMFPLFG